MINWKKALKKYNKIIRIVYYNKCMTLYYKFQIFTKNLMFKKQEIKSKNLFKTLKSKVNNLLISKFQVVCNRKKVI